MDHHLTGEGGAGNSRNGYGKKTVLTDSVSGDNRRHPAFGQYLPARCRFDVGHQEERTSCVNPAGRLQQGARVTVRSIEPSIPTIGIRLE